MPPVLADALYRGPRSSAWVRATAVGVTVSHPDAGHVGLEALVAHHDRLALHFIAAGNQDKVGAWGLVVTGTDERGRGHVAHPEALSRMKLGAFHFRPPLANDAGQLTIRLEGPNAVVNVSIDLAGSAGG